MWTTFLLLLILRSKAQRDDGGQASPRVRYQADRETAGYGGLTPPFRRQRCTDDRADKDGVHIRPCIRPKRTEKHEDDIVVTGHDKSLRLISRKKEILLLRTCRSTFLKVL